MGIFGGIGKPEVKATRDSNYVQPGRYVCIINAITSDVSRKKIPYIAVSMTVLKCIAPGQSEQEGYKPHSAGEDISHLHMSDKDMFLPNVMAMVMGLVGCEEHEVNEEACDEMVDPKKQPFAGCIITINAREVITRGKGEPFTRVSYEGWISQEELNGFHVEYPIPSTAKLRTDAA